MLALLVSLATASGATAGMSHCIVQELTPQAGAPEPESFGDSLAVSGEWAFVGDYWAGGFDGRVDVYRRGGGGLWEHAQVITAAALDSDARLAGALAAAGDLLVIGAPSADGLGNNSGAALVYRLSGDAWVLDQVLRAPVQVDFGLFGRSVATDGSRVAVAASGDRGVTVFAHDGADWAVETHLLDPAMTANNNFGHAIGLDGDWLAVAAPLATSSWAQPNAGRIHLFERQSDGTWPQHALPGPSGLHSGEHLGSALAIRDGLLVAGASGRSDATGAAYVFIQETDGSWQPAQRLQAESFQVNDNAGAAVAIHGGLVVVGAQLTDLGGSTWVGAVHLFRRIGRLRWAPLPRKMLTDPMASDGFGGVLASDGRTLLTVAPGRSAGGTAYGVVYEWDRCFGARASGCPQ